MTIFHFIAAPANNTKQLTLQKLQNKIASTQNDYAEVYAFSLPEFKIGTLDSLVIMSEELTKVDTQIEAIVNKLAENIKTLLDNPDQLKSNLVVQDRQVEVYLKNFQWNSIKYRADKTLKEISEALVQDVLSIDNLIKNKLSNYNSIKGSLAGIERKQVGNLSVKSLNDVVKRQHFVLDSEYLQTVLVAVPRPNVKEFLTKYETLSNMVVPRSHIKIAEDEEYALFAVVVFKKVHEEFITKLRENKYTPRDYTFDEEQIAKERKENSELGIQAKEQKSTLIRLCKTNFSEIFSAWVHIKGLRVFIEAILRYGLPPDFQPMIVKPKNKQEKKVVDILTEHYARLGSSLAKGSKDEEMEDIQGVIYDKEYTPYVNFNLKWDY